MPGPYAPNDDLVGPISLQIASLLSTQIPSIAHVYECVPDGQPGDNTVVLRLTDGTTTDDTSGKLRFKLMFRAVHTFRQAKISDAYLRAYSYITPWLKFLAAWPNQPLGGLVRDVTSKKWTVLRVPQAGQAMVALVVDFQIISEMNIPLT